MSPMDAAGEEARIGSIASGRFRLGYRIEGHGKPAMVVGSSIFYARTFSANLRRRLRLAFVDHRGFAPANGDVTVDECGLETIVADIERMRAALDLQDFLLIGHSGHAYMALEYAKRYPQHVSHMLLIGCGPGQGDEHMRLAERHWQESVCPERKARFEADMAQLAADIAAEPQRRFAHFCVRFAARAWYDMDIDVAALWRDVPTNMTFIDHAWGEIFRDLDIRAGLERLAMPVMLALGRFDYQVAPAWTWEGYRPLFRDLTVRIFDRSGHTPQFEESDAFDAELMSWLAAKGVP